MRILMVGAGAVGGYFGGRLLQAGRDVTFLVRPGRAAQLREHGLRLASKHGDATLHPALVDAGELRGDYDAIMLTVKAYALEAAMADIAPAVAGGAVIVPALNGMRHLDLLTGRFGEAAVAGGVCLVTTTLDADGRIVQLTPVQEWHYGARAGAASDRLQALHAALQGAGFIARLSSTILHDMWEKWVFLAALGALTCLMRGPVGAIAAAPGGLAAAESLLGECNAVAAAEGFAARDAYLARIRGLLTAAGSPLTSSMYRDLQAGAPVEADQIVGDMLARAQRHHVATPLLRAAYAHLSVYQAARAPG